VFQPDITAPGVNIIAAYTEVNSEYEITSDNRRISYKSLSGTSMACPHVSGIVGLLKTLHPKWSPAAIKSAIMTTGTTSINHPTYFNFLKIITRQLSCFCRASPGAMVRLFPCDLKVANSNP